MNNKINAFIENAQLINGKFNIIPLLYGSLGLEYLTKTSFNADDIDILIPEVYVKGSLWEEFKSFLEQHNYKLVDLHEHTFRKDDIDYSYASIENLEEFADIKNCDIEILSIDDTSFKLLNAEQYLRVYKKSSKDGYRINHKHKEDNAKVKFLNKYITNSSK